MLAKRCILIISIILFVFLSKLFDVGNYARYHGDKCKLRFTSEQV